MPQPLRVELDDSHHAIIDVAAGEKVELVVRGGGATGHVWEVDADPACRVVSRKFEDPGSGAFGGDVTEHIVIEPLESTAVTLQLRRPWESRPVRSLNAELRVAHP